MPVGLVTLLAMTACSTAPRSDEGKSDIRAEAPVAVSKAEANDPTLSPLLRNSYGATRAASRRSR